VITLQLLFFVLCAAVVLCFNAIRVFDKSTRTTSLPILIAWVVVGGASAWVVAAILHSRSLPPLALALVVIGMAMVLTLDRRKT
jgi:hypothetical protein